MVLKIRSENGAAWTRSWPLGLRHAPPLTLGLMEAPPHEGCPAENVVAYQDVAAARPNGTQALANAHGNPHAPACVAVDVPRNAFTSLSSARPCWRAFAASAALHLFAILVVPAVVHSFARGDAPQTARRERTIQALRIRIPEQFYLAAPAPAVPRVRPARAGGAPDRGSSASPPVERASSAPEPARRFVPPPARRRFELPPVLLRAETDLTVLQSGRRANALPRVQLPELFFWGPPPPERVLKPFVRPGSARPQTQQARLDAPPRLDVPGAAVVPVTPRALPGPGALQAPAPLSIPLRTSVGEPRAIPAPPEITASGPGDPVNILVLSASPSALKEFVSIPPGSQIGHSPGLAAGSGLAGTATGSDTGSGSNPAGSASAARATGSGAIGAASGSGGAGTGAAPGGSGTGAGTAAGGSGTGRATAGSGAGSAAAGTGSGSGSGAGAGAAAGGSGMGAGGGLGAGGRGEAVVGGAVDASGLTAALRAAIEATRMVNPSNAVFDIVVQSSGPEGFTESAGILSGRPVYSVFMNVGAPREWILQYCIPGSEPPPAAVSPGAVSLAAPKRLLPPFPLVTFRPPPRRSRARYLMLHGFITAQGRFEGLRVVGAADPTDAAAALAALDRWEFRPATEDRKPTRVEVLVAIPGE